MRPLYIFVLLSALLFSTSPLALGTRFGFTLPILIIGKDPKSLHGVNANFSYQPEAFIWKSYTVYFIVGAGHWWSNHADHHKIVNIFSIAPVFRFYLFQTLTLSPFVELSIGPSYLTKTRFDDRNLGIHFAFQDAISVGFAIGSKKNSSISLIAMHYSNGSLARMNAGITMPLMLNLAYHM